MQIRWGGFWHKSRAHLKTGWLITAGLIALYLGAIAPLETPRRNSMQKATGLSPVPTERRTFSLRSPTLSRSSESMARGVVGGVPGGVPPRDMMTLNATIPAVPPAGSEDRKLVRTGAMDLIVKNPGETAEKIRQLADRMGGFLQSSQVTGSSNSMSASVTIRVPAARLEEARSEIRKLGLRVETDRIEAQDATKEYVDREARLRNLRAQETQYLNILRQAKTVKDTLQVSDQLNEVRSEIEQQQAEFEALSKQVEMAAISISLGAEADAQVFGLQWRPLYQFKLAAREGMQSLADYATSMVSFAFYLPAILLWLATILLGTAVGWRILRWTAHVVFGYRKKVIEAKA
jgi:hypothetical protein